MCSKSVNNDLRWPKTQFTSWWPGEETKVASNTSNEKSYYSIITAPSEIWADKTINNNLLFEKSS